MWAGAGLTLAALLAPGPARAYETKSWMPRRHYRGLKEARKAPEFEVLQQVEMQTLLLLTYAHTCQLTIPISAEESDMGH